MAAGNEEIALCVERQACGIYERSDKRLHGVAGINLVERNRNPLAARAAESDINIPGGIHCWMADRMQVVGDLESDGDRERLAFALRVHDLDGVAVGVFRYARDQAVAAGQRKRRFGLAEADQRAAAVARSESTAKNRNFTAGNRSGGRQSLKLRGAVVFSRGATPQVSCRLPWILTHERVQRDASQAQPQTPAPRA